MDYKNEAFSGIPRLQNPERKSIHHIRLCNYISIHPIIFQQDAFCHTIFLELHSHNDIFIDNHLPPCLLEEIRSYNMEIIKDLQSFSQFLNFVSRQEVNTVEMLLCFFIMNPVMSLSHYTNFTNFICSSNENLFHLRHFLIYIVTNVSYDFEDYIYVQISLQLFNHCSKQFYLTPHLFYSYFFLVIKFQSDDTILCTLEKYDIIDLLFEALEVPGHLFSHDILFLIRIFIANRLTSLVSRIPTFLTIFNTLLTCQELDTTLVDDITYIIWQIYIHVPSLMNHYSLNLILDSPPQFMLQAQVGNLIQSYLSKQDSLLSFKTDEFLQKCAFLISPLNWAIYLNIVKLFFAQNMITDIDVNNEKTKIFQELSEMCNIHLLGDHFFSEFSHLMND